MPCLPARVSGARSYAPFPSHAGLAVLIGLLAACSPLDPVLKAEPDVSSGITQFWNPAEPINTSGYASDVQVAVDASGVTHVIWVQFNGINEVPNLWRSRWESGSGWHSPELMGVNVSTRNPPRLVADPDGRVFAAWAGNSGEFRLARYEPAGGWQAAETLGATPPNSSVSSFSIAGDGHGGCLVAWTRWQTAMTTLQASFWQPGGASSGSWQSVRVIEQQPEIFAERLHVATLANGTALAAWSSYEQGKQVVRKAEFAASTWTAPTTMLHDVQLEALTSDRDSRALMAWSDHGGRGGLMLSQWNPGVEWASVAISPAIPASNAVRLGIDAQGNSLLAWSSATNAASGSSNSPALLTGRCTASLVCYSYPRPLDSLGEQPSLAMASDGTAFLSWTQAFATVNSKVALLKVAPADVRSPVTGTALSPGEPRASGIEVAVSPSAQYAGAAWIKRDSPSTATVWATHYGPMGR